MVFLEEENFPRGGRKVVNQTLKRGKQDDNLFFGKSPKVKKNKKAKPTEEVALTDETFHNSLKIHGTLSYKKLQDGMVILACIRHITDFSIEVELPGLTFGRVSVTNISDAFTKYLNKKLENNSGENEVGLKNIFKTGQFVIVKVLSIENTDKGKRVKCTMNPRDVNSERFHDSFKKTHVNMGMCRVNSRSWLRTIGQPLFCIVHKSETMNSVTTLRVSSKGQHLKIAIMDNIDALHNVIPGMQVELVIEKVLPAGIQGKFINDYFGYVDESHLHSVKSKDCKEGKVIKAVVLYVEPATKVTHLTLHDLGDVPDLSHNIGDTASAEVVIKGQKGLYLKLPTKEICFVSTRRLVDALSKNSNVDISNSIKTKFPVGSKHTCRILDYSSMSRVYICAVDQSTVKEKLFSSQDVKIGQLLTVVIDSIKSEGIIVTAGHIRGFVPNLHISNVTYSENLKKKFREGQKTNARVLNVLDDNILFTLKSGLVESENCLTAIDQVKRGDQYAGVVVQTKPSGVLVAYYGEIKGWLPKKNLVGIDNDRDFDPEQYFYRGQVINPWVLGVRGDNLVLTMKELSKLKRQEQIKIGQRFTGVVSKIHKDKVDVKLLEGKVVATIPVNHLSCVQSLCPVILKTYKAGNKISDLICINNKSQPPILSRREGLIFNKKNRIMKFSNVKQGTLLRCSYISNCKAGIYVLPLLADYSENILIKTKDVINKGQTFPQFTYHQSIVARVLKINQESKELRLTIKFSEVFDNNVETVTSFFSHYLTDIKYLRKFGYKNGWGLCQYQPGERVTCKIEQLGDEGGCLVTLPNDVKGLVAPRLCPGYVKPGQTIEGVFLSQDFNDDYVEVCLKQDICQKINKQQDGVIDASSLASCTAETILVKNDSILGVLKQESCRRQLVYIPLYLHENDINGSLSYYDKDKFRICICGKVGEYLIGMSKKLFLTLDKKKANSKKKKVLKTANKNVDEGNTNIGNGATNGTSQSDECDDFPVQNTELDVDESEEEYEEEITHISCEETSQNESEVSGSESDTEEPHIKTVSTNGTKRKANDNITFGDETVKKFATNDSITGPLPILPGVSKFFNPNVGVKDDLSSDEEEESVSVKKKKKMTPAERAELARQEEERISRIEKELADSTSSPKSAEQFDRLLLANPNSSELWTKYMSFHIAVVEFDKARSVAKRALESINLTLTEERFNIWVALLNLENMFGTKDSFEKTFEEAVRCNDSLQTYLKAIQILADANKFTEMEEKIKKVRSKHKQEPAMWLEVAKILYSNNKLKEARNMKEAALKSIQDRKTQLNLIVRFAILEFKYGEEEQGAAIFETILSSDPRKVTVWTTYVDQLVNKDRIDQARRVLERSVCQRLPVKSMKSLFLKFRMFEEKHGTPESVEMVKEKAKEYVVRVAEK
ncbi:hypothetical protein NQ318_011077 [Aromia moschata]|uniref:S1 motif domain-containing protein n=1 Tax=Aromia moschata TaxID=1265417 RepID=A0AAV8YU29_9CUCU|nr:hypothetical protein NQ318_011077 [Aromia moschata]